MKGFIGAALTMLLQMQQTKLAKPIHFALSYDEEIGCAGVPLMIADLLKRGIKPDWLHRRGTDFHATDHRA